MSQEETTATGSDPLHIGNLIGIFSDQHGLVVGHVIYRDKAMVRVRPQEASDRAVEFPLAEDGSAFSPELGVQEVEVMEEATSDYYVDFLGARPGETLEFFTVDGEEADKPGEVAEVIKTASKDSIRLKDGRVLNFRGRGPKAPVAVIRVSTAANVAAAAPTGEEVAAAEDAAAVAAAAAAKRRTEILALLSEAVPVATVSVVPSAQQTYPETLQREEMFQDLLSQLPAKQRTNPRRIRFIEREVDLALALKSNVLLRDEAGNPDGFREVETRTLLETIRAAPGPVPVAVPIVAGARVLNVDVIPAGAKYRPGDVAPRILGDVEMESEVLASIYEDGALSATKATRVAAALQETAAQRAAQGFYGYLYDLLGRDQVTLKGDIASGAEWTADQDVIRTAGLSKAVQGFGAGLPDEDTPVTLSLLTDDVTTRSLRMLTPLKYTNQRTGETYLAAPSDPSHITGYVMLPPKAALKLRPPVRPGDLPTALLYSAALEDDNLPTIAQALRDLYSVDPEPQNAWMLSAAGGDSPGADTEVAKWLDTVLRYAVHPSDSLGPRTPRIMSVLDAFGLGETDLPGPVAAVVHRWVKRSQAQWRDLLTAQRSATQKALNEDVARTFQSVTGADSPLWPALLAAPAPLSELIADIRRRNPAIGEAPTLLSVSIQHEAQGDAAPLAWGLIAGLDTRPIAVDQAAAADALTASRSYVLRRKALRDLPLLRLRAAPEINTCPHVATLEAIRNQRDTLQRSRLLREFIEEYQGGRDGDWITCALCRQQAVCYHELMELEAMAQPARMAAIQKQILVRYGGSRFEGKVVCRNCGQGLQDIDYDEGVEFDDEGRAVTGMSVLTEEQMEEPTESTWKKATADLVAAPVTFDTTSKREIADILQFLAGRAGLVMTPALIQTIVTRADQYATANTPPPAAYEAFRKKQMTAASAKVSAVTGASGTVSYASQIPTYAAVTDQQRVVGIAALLGIALQAADPPIVVTNPVALCQPFSREGWPLAADTPPAESKMLKYISCAVASIDQPFAPWSHLTWVAIGGKLEKRTDAVLKAVVAAAMAILGPGPKTPVMPYKGELLRELQKMREDEEGAKRRALVSRSDELPVGFRPEPFPPAVGRPAVERDPAAPVAAALASGRTDEVVGLLPGIAGAIRQQAVALIGELHAAASAGVPKGAQITSVDATCCPTPFRDVEAGALRGAPAIGNLETAAALARRGQPTVPNAGSHLWTVFALPIGEPVEESVDPGVYFKLFLKYCYTGAQVGEAHEFSAGNRCRQCGLSLGKPLELVDFGKEGAAILAAQEGALRVEASATAFEALSQAIRRRRLLGVEAAPVRPEWTEGVLAFADALDRTPSAGLKALAAAVRESVTAVEAGGAAAATDDLARVQLWAPVTMIHDAARAAVTERVAPRGEKQGQEAITMVNTLLEDPWVEGPRAVQEYWCAKTLAEGRQKYITTVKGARWFKLSPKHNDMINVFLEKNATSWFSGGLPAEARPVIAAIGETLGPVISLWIRSVRPTTASIAWGAAEAQQLLRALLFQIWQDATNPLSEMYASFTTAAERETLARVVANWTRVLMIHAKQQFIRFSDERVRQIIQQQAEMERSSIVKEFSDIRDDEQRAAEIAKKQFRIGRWARGANLTKLDANRFDEEIEQRRAMGIVDAPVDPILLEGGAAAAGGAEDFGFRTGAPEEGSAYDVDQAADGDNY